MTLGFAPAAQARESSPFERRLTRGTAVAVLLLLASTILQSSIFLRINSAVAGLTGYLSIHLIVHAAIACVAIAYRPFRRRMARFRPVFYWLAAYGGAVSASTIINVEPLAAARVLDAALIPATILSLAIALPAILRSEDYDVLYRGVIAIFVVSAIVSLWLVATQRSSFLGHPLVVQFDGRGGSLGAAGLFTHRNTIGSFLQFVPVLILVVLGRVGERAGDRRTAITHGVLLAALALVLVHLGLTFSRSSQIVVALSLLPLLVRGLRGRPSMAYILVAAILLTGVVVVMRVPEFAGYVALGFSLLGRQSVWESVLVRTAPRPLLGFGLLNTQFRNQTPHNAFLAQVGYFGLIGFAAFLGLLAVLGGVVWQRQRSRRDWSSWLIFALLVAVLLQGLVEYVLTFPIFFANSMFWILAGRLTRDD